MLEYSVYEVSMGEIQMKGLSSRAFHLFQVNKVKESTEKSTGS
jgi:hypothetical protein